MGRTNSCVKGGGNGTYQMNWNDLSAFTLGENLSENPYEITIPPSITSIADMFRGAVYNGPKRTYNLIIHNSGSDITSMYRAFSYSNNYNRQITLDFDTSKVTNFSDLFSLGGSSAPAKITVIGTLDFSSATNVSNMFGGWMYNASYISSFRLAEGSLGISWSTGGCNPDDDTLASIVAGLKDMTGETSPTLTLNSNVKARLTQTQLDTISAKNWTLA